MNEFREYKGRRASKKTPVCAKPNYFKKFLRQSFVSMLIFSIIFSNSFFKSDLTAKIQAFAKNALEYKIDLSAFSDSIKKFFKHSIPTSIQGEIQNENTSNPEKNL